MEIKLTLKLASAARAFDPRGRLPDLDAQTAWFRAKFPGGFDDPAWRRDARGKRPAGRDAVGLARATAALPSIVARRGSGDDDAVRVEVVRALRAARLSLLRSLDELPRAVTPATTSTAWLDALAGLLAARDGDVVTRFDAWVAAHAKATWPSVTTLPALCDPVAHAFVRPTLLDAQASVLGVSTGRAARPAGGAYAAMRSVTRALATELDARGLAPQDLLDVALFSAQALPGAQRAKAG